MLCPPTQLALLTDLYEITMAYGYWRSGTANKEAAFHLSFRNQPFDGGYTVACGLADAVEWLNNLRFTESDLEFLRCLDRRGSPRLFDDAFLQYLRELRFTCDVDAVTEGTVVFPHEPLVTVQGPILQAQIVETALLNIINFQSLIATKAARICVAAQGDPVIEFGLRRAQGIDGGLSATRAAYIGGCASTSNLLAAQRYGIPAAGTHAHSWVMSFETEIAAFEAYAEAMPNNAVFLVDTYDSLQGVRHAVSVGARLRAKGYDLAGIRLDSGDLAYLSVQARKILDGAGFPKAAIVASNDLDEHIITSLKLQRAAINVWGVGTKLVTAFDQPALGGVYKLSAIRNPGEDWHYKVKLSEQTAKTTTPGLLQVRRFQDGNEFIGDAIYDSARPLPDVIEIVDPIDPIRNKIIPSGTHSEDLLVPVFRKGEQVFSGPTIMEIRERVQEQLSHFHSGVKRLVNPHRYPAGLEASLHLLKTQLLQREREQVAKRAEPAKLHQ